MSDTMIAYDTPRPVEQRAEVAALDALHHERRQLMITLAPLKAVHGPFGMFDHRRKQMVEAMKVKARLALTQSGAKITETLVDAEGHSDPQYLAFLDQMESEKIEYLHQDTRLSEIEEQIRSREIELLTYNAEIKLAR